MAGLKAFAGGIGFILGTPAVWPYALVPLLAMLILTCGLGGLGLWGAPQLTEMLVGRPEGAWGQAGAWVLTVLLALAALWLAWLTALLLAQPLSGFALEEIARAQEFALRGRAPRALSLVRSLLLSLRITLLTGVLGLPLLVLTVIGFLFPPAAVLTVPLNFVGGAWLLAWNFLDYPLGLHGFGIGARLYWVSRHFGAFSAFGVAWALLLLVPGIFLVVLPMGVAGAAHLVATADQKSQPWPVPARGGRKRLQS